MQRLLDAVDAGEIDASVALVLSDNADAAGLSLAAERGVATCAVARSDFSSKPEWEHAVDAVLRDAGANLLALAGFMRVLSADFCAKWHGHLVNIHPSLLPRHKGLNTHQRALDAGESNAGCSVHFVTAELDGGPVIAQSEVAINVADTADTLAERVLAKEHLLYPQAIGWCASGRVALTGSEVQFDGRKLDGPIRV